MIPSPEAALARWFAHGVTSATHPVLRYVLDRFFRPLGIEAESLEAEPFSAIESGLGDYWLRQPYWSIARFDPAHPARDDFLPLLTNPESFMIAVDSRGLLQLSPASGTAGGAAREFLGQEDRGWSAIRHSVKACARAEAFIFAAAGFLCASDPIAEIYLRGNDAEYCREVARRMDASPG